MWCSFSRSDGGALIMMIFRFPEIIHVGTNYSLYPGLVPWVEKSRNPDSVFRFQSCLRCGARNDRYCGCWRDRLYAKGTAPSGRSVDFKGLSPTNHRRSHRQPHATPILQYLDMVPHMNRRDILENKEGTGTSVPVIAQARSAHPLDEGGGWV